MNIIDIILIIDKLLRNTWFGFLAFVIFLLLQVCL